MILKTKIEVREEDLSKLTEAEREKYQARKDYYISENKEFEPDDSVLTSRKIDVVIDTVNNTIYVDEGDGTITMKHLLAMDLVTNEDGQAMYLYPTVNFEGKIDQIYKELKKDNKI